MIFTFRPAAWPSSRRRYYHSSKKKKGGTGMNTERIEDLLIDKLIDAPCYITLHRFVQKIPTETHRELRKAYNMQLADGTSYSSEENRTTILYNEVKDENGKKKDIEPCFILDIKNITSVEDEACSYSQNSKLIVGRFAEVHTTGLNVSSWKVNETAEEVKNLIEEAVKKRQEEILRLTKELKDIFTREKEQL